MRNGRTAWPLLFSLFLALAFCRPAAAEVVEVPKSYDGSSFSYRMGLAGEKPAFRVYRLSYPSPVATAGAANNTVPAEYYLARTAPTATGRGGRP